CRVGNRLLEALVEKVAAGKASAYDLEEMRRIGELMRQASYCGLGTTAANHVRDILDKFPATFQHRLRPGNDFTPAFDLDAALAVARAITGRNDAGAHLEEV
ncbi:MAG: NADP oxidoreductase, partial [Gammaproteobacteria bacterium]|nr:NADP oxidoreductase [Gammaproteobacteria bacterium]